MTPSSGKIPASGFSVPLSITFDPDPAAPAYCTIV